MLTLKLKFLPLLIALAMFSPSLVAAQTADDSITAKAYVLMDANTKQILASENADLSWTPASLTKLVTVLVVLDAKPKLTKTVTMTKADQTIGECGRGGVCISSAAGVKFTFDGLYHATVIKSANNAANALARASGLSTKQFVKKMNAKAKALGATHSVFYEPTGLNPNNKTTASDYVKIVAAAFANPYLNTFYQQASYDLVSANNGKYNQTVTTHNPLINSSEIDLVGAKTGYLPESKYNLATVLKYDNEHEFIIVVFGEPHMWMAYDDTKYLADLGKKYSGLAYK